MIILATCNMGLACIRRFWDNIYVQYFTSTWRVIIQHSSANGIIAALDVLHYDIGRFLCRRTRDLPIHTHGFWRSQT